MCLYLQAVLLIWCKETVGSDINVEFCQRNGFSSNLLCSSCRELEQFSLQPLIEPCNQCCEHDEASQAKQVGFLYGTCHCDNEWCWTMASQCCNRGVRPYRPQTILATISATAISATAKTISATAKNHIGRTENQYRPQPYRPQNIRRVYLASSCRYFSCFV